MNFLYLVHYSKDLYYFSKQNYKETFRMQDIKIAHSGKRARVTANNKSLPYQIKPTLLKFQGINHRFA